MKKASKDRIDPTRKERRTLRKHPNVKLLRKIKKTKGVIEF